MGIYHTTQLQNALFWVGSAAPFYRSHPKVQLGDFPTSPAMSDPRKFRRSLKQGPQWPKRIRKIRWGERWAPANIPTLRF